MAAPIGNQYAKGKKTGRMGYTYEKDQLQKMRRLVNLALAKTEAIEKGKMTDKQIERFKVLQPIYLKAMDKLHANKQHLTGDLEVTSKVVKLDE